MVPVQHKLIQMEREGLIEKVDSPQARISNIVVIPKNNNDVRICLDAREINKAIVREKFPIPTLNSLVDEMSAATIFSNIYLREAYTQIELSENSKRLTNFISEDGIYRFSRLIYGTNDAGDIFQRCLQSKISDLKGVNCISDDIIVYGKCKEDHNENLKKLFYRLQKYGFKINGSKCILGKSSISFFGVILSAEGVKPDPDKVDCLYNAPAPVNQGELKSFLGLCTFMSLFIPNYSDKTAPLRELIKKNVQFKWGESQENAFKVLKTELSCNSVVSYLTLTSHVVYGLMPAILRSVEFYYNRTRTVTPGQLVTYHVH